MGHPVISKSGPLLRFIVKSGGYYIFHYIIMCRVNMEGTEIIGKENYYVTAREEDIRPYGILYKKI